jgi:hypothetical protein
VLILPAVWELFGVQSCQAVSDIFAFFFAMPFTFLFFKTLKKETEKCKGNSMVDIGQVCDEMKNCSWEE